MRCFLFVSDIQATVASYYGIPPSVMTGPDRRREYARPRQIAMYLTRKLTRRSLPEIGKRFGRRDHSTVLYGVRHIEEMRQYDPEIDRDVAVLAGELMSLRTPLMGGVQ